MATENKSVAGANWLWAALTPFILAAVAGIGIGLLFTRFMSLAPLFIAAGLFFLPALCVYLDGRSRTFAGAVTLCAGMALSVWLLGAPALAVSACIAVATAAVTVLRRTKAPFPTGLAGSAAGGVMGFVALLGILGGSMDKPINEAAAGYLTAMMAGDAAAGYALPLNMFTLMIKLPSASNWVALLANAGSVPSEILSMSVDEKLAVVRPVLETAFAIGIPSLALAGGMLMGGLGYWLPQLALARGARKLSAGPDAPVPAFAAFKVPKYIVVALLLLQIVASFGASAENIGWLTVRTAVELVMGILMTLQAMALFSFLLNRKKVAPVFQILIFIPAVLLFSWLMYWVGIFDALFDMRAVLPRVEAVRAKGKQVFTPEGLEQLRKMQEDARRNDKKGKDGEDGQK